LEPVAGSGQSGASRSVCPGRPCKNRSQESASDFPVCALTGRGAKARGGSAASPLQSRDALSSSSAISEGLWGHVAASDALAVRVAAEELFVAVHLGPRLRFAAVDQVILLSGRLCRSAVVWAQFSSYFCLHSLVS